MLTEKQIDNIFAHVSKTLPAMKMTREDVEDSIRHYEQGGTAGENPLGVMGVFIASLVDKDRGTIFSERNKP